MQYQRRRLLEAAATGAGGLLLGGSAAKGAATKPAGHDPYELVPLGKTGLKVSRVGLGTGVRGWMRQSNHTRIGAKKFDALVGEAWERGVRLFDTADLYGTHPHLARALAKMRRDRYVLESKVWLRREGLPGGEPDPAGEAVLRFLKELKTDYIDIVLLHGVMDEDWPKRYGDQMEDLAKLRKKGVIRAHGVAAHSLAALKTAAEEKWVQTVLARINPFGVAMDDKPDKVLPVLKKLHAAGKGVIAMKVLGAGKFAADAKKRQASIRYVLGLDCVDAMVVGFETPAHVDSFGAAVPATARR